MAANVQKKLDTNYEYQKIATERLLWLAKPLTIFGLFVWCLHPSTSEPEFVDRNAMLGFLLGAFAGLLVNAQVLKYYLFTRRTNTSKNTRNRVPDEYYFGKIKEVLYQKKD
ncbi:MAG: hypothetical protein GC134_07310 [Proteobacteria bacterium]|nr:hypothetical protein [Pseudomonadota bacterium]